MPAVSDPTTDASCAALWAGTAGIPVESLTRSIPGTNIEQSWESAGSGDLPEEVDIRTTTETFNRRYQFALRDDRLWFSRISDGARQWRTVPLPACLEGGLRAISADDDELAAVDSEGRIFTLDGILSDPALWNWTNRWGPYLWAGTGFRIPSDTTAWSFSDLSNAEDVTWTDRAGNSQRVGGGKVTTIYVLRGDRRTITFLDPWLPNDTSYEVCGPFDGRLELEALSASGSTIAVMTRHGDVFARLYDFDISGGDAAFFGYSYEDQRERPNPLVQLPAPDWVDLGRPPGRVTDRLSIHKTGTDSVHRIVRVGGIDDYDNAGFWEREVAGGDWEFHARAGQIEGTALAPAPSPAVDPALLGTPYTRAYGPAPVEGAVVEVPAFHYACTPTALHALLPSGEQLELVLHSVDGLRQEPREEGLVAEQRRYYAAIEVPDAVRDAASPEARTWLEHTFGLKQFTETELLASTGSLVFPELGWTLPAIAGGETLVARPDPGGDPAAEAWRLRRAGAPLPNFASDRPIGFE